MPLFQEFDTGHGVPGVLEYHHENDCDATCSGCAGHGSGTAPLYPPLAQPGRMPTSEPFANMMPTGMASSMMPSVRLCARQRNPDAPDACGVCNLFVKKGLVTILSVW